jgi:membrane protein
VANATLDRCKRFGKDVVDEFVEDDLLTYASAIAFQALFAIIPLALCALAVLGFLGLEDIYDEEILPSLRDSLDPAPFTVVDDTVRDVLTNRRTLWLTFGAGLALWQISGAIRAAMGALNIVYGADEARSWAKRFVTSFVLAAAVMVCVLGAVASVQLVPLAMDAALPGVLGSILGFLVRWGIAIALLVVAVGLIVHWAPAVPQPFRWAGFGTALVVGLWILGSVGFGLYLSYIADYESVFGNLASVIALLTWLYISSLALLVGVTADSMARERATGSEDGNGATSG